MLYKSCLLLLLTIPEYFSERSYSCDSQQSDSYPITWPETWDYTFSEPLCIGKTKESLYRNCYNGSWDLEPTCEYIQTTEIPLCPEGFTKLGKYCYQINSKTKFPPQCPYPDLLPFEDSVTLLEGTDPNPTSAMPNYESPRSVFSEALWVPAVRNTANGFDFIRWIEVSGKYGQELKTEAVDDATSKNCVVYENWKYRATYCDEEHATLCVYNNVLNLTEKNCSRIGNQSNGSCFRYDMSSRTSCACLEGNSSQTNLAEFQEIYQNNAAVEAVQLPCVFGLKKNSDGKYVWVSSQEEINYTLWSPDVVFNDTFVYGKFSKQWWYLTNNTSEEECFINQREIKALIPTLKFNTFRGDEALTLCVENVEWLSFKNGSGIFCFTDSTDNEFIYEIRLDKISETILAIPGSVPGYHWCEAFQYSDLSIIKSERVFYRNPFSFEFPAIFRLAWPLNLENVDSDLEEYLRSNVLSLFNEKSADFLFIPRLIKINSLDYEQKFVEVNIHFTIKDRLLNMSNAEEMFRSMEYIVSSSIPEAVIDIEMHDFLSSDYCMVETINNLTFPTTELLDPALEVPSEPLCFDSDGNLIKRSCKGDFTNGAYWFSEVSFENCTSLTSSYQTLNLLPLLTLEHLELTQLDHFSREINTFFAVDIYLLVQLIIKAEKETSEFFTFIAAIGEAERDVLLESFKVTKSTDNLLAVLSDHLKTYNGSSFGFNSSTFVAIIVVNENVIGIAVEHVDGNYRILYLNNLDNCSEDDLIATNENIEFAVCFTQKVRTSVAFTIFFKDSLFNQNPKLISIKNVFGIHLMDGSKFPVPIKILQKSLSTPISGCAIYKPNTNFGWEYVNSYKENDTFSTCTVLEDGYVAFVFNNANSNGSVTDDLEDLLDSDVEDDVKIGTLADISERFSEFNEKDVSLVGQILDTLTENTLDLQPLARVVNNLHKVEKAVLFNSQKESKTLDKILQNTDSILKDSTILENFLSTENFFVVTSTNINGVLLLEKDTFEIQVLSGNSSIEEINSFDNIISFLFLSSELKNQLPKNSKIIITIFVNDTLFYEECKNSQKLVSTVFGVILPEIENFSGPIIIEHNMSANYNKRMHCSHWNYGSSTAKSFWRKDMDGLQSETFLRCDFWHTTHFALLLLERDLYDDDINFWITMVSSVMSLIGLCIIFLTGVLFENWRRKIGNQILLNFSLAITLEIIMFHIGGIFKNPSSFFCTSIGMLLQYSIMCQFSWTLIVAVIQFRRFVIVFASSPRNLLIKCCFCGWVLPLIPVFYTLVLSNGIYTNINTGLCYPSGLGLYYGMWLPISAITLVNLTIFIYIVVCLLRANSTRTVQDTLDNKHQTRLFIMLFFMLGLTWCFGFLSFLDLGMVFSYAFNSTATLQGFILFLYYIVFNSNTRQLYARCFKKVLFSKQM